MCQEAVRAFRTLCRKYATGSNARLGFRKIGPSRGSISQNHPLPKASEPKWSDSIGRTLDSVRTWNGGVAREECVLVQCGVPARGHVHARLTLDIPLGIILQCCRHGRFERQTDLFTKEAIVTSSNHPDREWLSAHTRFHMASPSPTPASTPSHCRRQARSHSQCPKPLSHPLPSPAAAFFYRSSVTPLDLHVELILMRIGPYARRFHSRSAVTIALSGNAVEWCEIRRI
jgi:hypothetical protein